MAANMGLSPDIMETEAYPPDKGILDDGGGSHVSLMERLRGRCAQYRSWSDTIKAIRLVQVNDKRLQTAPVEKSSLQSCLDTLHRAMKITNHQSLIERLDLISRQLGMIFTPPTMTENQVTLSSEMFKVVVVLEGQSGIKDVRVGHQEPPTSCEELVEVLSKGNFEEFISHLQGLLSIYIISGDKKQKMKGYLALSSLEADLNLLAQLQSSINGVANYIHKSPLGILLPRRGGHPMKLIYYVSPYDLLCKKTKSSYQTTVEAITDNALGHSVTVCLEASVNNNKLQTMPLNSVKSNQDGKNLPSFQGVNNINSCSVAASFVLVLPQPIPVAKSLITAIQHITGLDVICDGEKSFLSVLIQHCSGGRIVNTKQLFVTLPDQQHVYFLNSASEGVLGGTGCLLRKIPFTHPTSVPNVLNLLRQQLVFNSVLHSIIRPQAKQEIGTAVVYEITAVSLHHVSVMFEHPLHNSMITVEFNLSDITSVKCNVFTFLENDATVSDDFVSKAFQRCFSIPVTLRAVIRRVHEEIRQLIPPEPVAIPVVKTRWTWTQPKAPVVKPKPEPVPVSIVSVPIPVTIPTPTIVSLPNPPPPYPSGETTWVSPMQQASSQQDMHKFTAPVFSSSSNRTFLEPSQAAATSTPPVSMAMPELHPGEARPPANPLLATLLDAGSPAIEPPVVQNIVNESPMLSKLLEENTSVAVNPFPAPNPRKRLTKRKSSKDIVAGKSPKHRLSEADMADRTSNERVNSERHGQGMGEKHIDLDSSGGSYDDLVRPSSVSSVSSIGGQSTGSIIDLTDLGESHVKKLENSLDSIMGKESPHQHGNTAGMMGLGIPNPLHMNSQLGMDAMDLNYPDLHHNQNTGHSLMGDPGMPGMGEFQPPLQWPSRQTPPQNSRNSPHHGVVPKNEKTSTSLEELLQGPRGREIEAPSSVHLRRNSQQLQRQSFKRQNSSGRNSVDSMPDAVSPGLDVFSPLITSPSHHPLASPTQLQQFSSPHYGIVSPSCSLAIMSPSHQPNMISPNMQLHTIKTENLNYDSKSGVCGLVGSHPHQTMNISPGVGMPKLGHHITSAGKPSLSMLKAQLENNDVKPPNFSAMSQVKDFGVNVKQEVLNMNPGDVAGALTAIGPNNTVTMAANSALAPVVKLKLTNMRQFESVSPTGSEESKSRSSTFDFHSDDDDEFGLPMVEKMTVVSASPTRLQITNKATIASFNKFNKSEKFKRKQREKELKVPLPSDSGKRKRDRGGEENKKDRKKKKVNSSYSVDKEMAVYKSTTVDVECGNENDHHKPMPKLKITKKCVKRGTSVENSVLQVKDVKSVEKNDKLIHAKDLKPGDKSNEKLVEKIVDAKLDSKLDKEVIVKIEKVERSSKKFEQEKEQLKALNSVKDSNKDSSSNKVVGKDGNKSSSSDKKKVVDTSKPCAPLTRTPSASDEGIFDKINAMKTEGLGKSDDSNINTSSSVGDKKSTGDIVTSAAASTNSTTPTSTHNKKVTTPTSSGSKSSVKSHKQRSSSTKSDSKISRTPTIKLKPITLPSNSTASVTLSRSSSNPNTPVLPKSTISQSPTSTTIGKIGAVSLATSGSQKQLSNSTNKSLQVSGSSATSSGKSDSAKSRSLSSSAGASALSSSKLNSSLQKNIQIQGPSGKNSPILQNNKSSSHSRSSSTSAVNSSSGHKVDKSLSKSLNTGNRTSSPSLEKEKSSSSKSSSGSSRSSSSSGRDRDREREKSTSSKTSVPVTTVITQETAASVLSFLNPKANKIASFTIPKLNSGKVSTPTSVSSPTVATSTCASTTTTTTTTNSSVKFSKGGNQTSTSVSKGGNQTSSSVSSKGSNSGNTSANSSKNTSNSNNSANVKNNSYKGLSNNSGNRPQNLAVTNTVNANRGGNNSPNSYSNKGGNNSNTYNKGSNSNTNNQNSGFRNYNSASSGPHQKSSTPTNASAPHANWNNNSGTSSSSYNKNSNNHSANHSNQGQNSSSHNRGSGGSNTNPKSSNSEMAGSTGSSSRQVASGNSVSNTNLRGSSIGPNTPKGPGPPSVAPGNPLDNISKPKPSGSLAPSLGQVAANRGRKGSLSAVIDKLTCKATGPSTIPTISTSSTAKSNMAKSDQVIVNESPASPEMEPAAGLITDSKEEKKVVIFDAPASPEPEISGPASPQGRKDSSAREIVSIPSIPLENKPSQAAHNSTDFSQDRTKPNLVKAVSEKSVESTVGGSQKTMTPLNIPKIIPLHSTTSKDIITDAKPATQPKSSTASVKTVNCSKDLSSSKQNSLPPIINAVSQQNGDISDYGDHSESNHMPDLSNSMATSPTKATKEVFKVPTPKRHDSVDNKSADDTDRAVDSTGSGSVVSPVKKKGRTDSYKGISSDPSSPVSSPENGLIIDFSPSSMTNHQNKSNSPGPIGSGQCIISDSPSKDKAPSLEVISELTENITTNKSSSPIKSSPICAITSKSPSLKTGPAAPKVRMSPACSPSGGRDNSSTGSNPNSPASPDDDLDLMDEALGLGN